MDEKLVGMISQYCLLTWEVNVDGASNQKGLGVGLVLVSPEKVVIEKSLTLDFYACNVLDIAFASNNSRGGLA